MLHLFICFDLKGHLQGGHLVTLRVEQQNILQYRC